jgi:hypothetical protein
MTMGNPAGEVYLGDTGEDDGATGGVTADIDAIIVGAGANGDNELTEHIRYADSLLTADKAKTRKQVKRRVGHASKTIKQMKDTSVIQVAVGAVTAISNLQSMTLYDTETKARNNPESSTFLLTYDEIVQSPRGGGEGERKRDMPVWNVLAPKGYDKAELGAKLMVLGQALKNEGLGTRCKSKRDHAALEVTYDARDFLGSIYGNEADDVLNKKKRYVKRGASYDDEL